MLAVHRQPSQSYRRWFGWSLGGMLGLLACLLWWRYSAELVALVLLGSGIVLAMVYYAVPRVQLPIIRGFRLLTLPLQVAVATLLIALLYYLVVTPIGLALRICGRDPLAKRSDSEVSTYWTKPDAPRETDSYFRQY